MSLPYVDEHVIRIAAPRPSVEAALDHFATAVCSHERPVLSRLLGLQPDTGFATAATQPGEHLRLEGRHRFASYALAFKASDDETGSTVQAITYAHFPGVQGLLYRALVIGSRGHAFATRRILRSIKRTAERRA